MERISSTTTTSDLLPLKPIPIRSRLPVKASFSKFLLACYIPSTEILVQ